jgi:RNA polymerase sigma factor (sigma-70 family)
MGKPSTTAPANEKHRRFATTRWSVVIAASRQGEESHAALAELCSVYWYPLYSYVRREGYSDHDAQDLTQGFIERLLEKNYPADARRERGRFRAFLLASLKHFLSNERDRVRAKKRGGGKQVISWDAASADARFRSERPDKETPEKTFNRRWALAIIARALERLGSDYRRLGKGKLFERLKGALTEDAATASHEQLAKELHMTCGAVKVAVHRLRRRYRDILRDEIAQTLADSAEVEDELRDLFSALG